ncbi:F-box domain-containing protein [Mycena venus]|uniref:F-box domain-containing protein n=1 Tax=Mycena venus TaxID=2733690 RepID=A0A8H7D8K0_9AGAR|nr:F-box domain-containing protein [Mycena venus]
MRTTKPMSSVSTSIVAASPLPGIHSLPTELICLIFSFTQASMIAIAMTEKRPSTPVLYTLARVCAQWRRIGQNLPDLWTYILIQDSSSATVEMVEQFLRRSNGLPLHIFLNIPICINRHRDGTAFQGIFQKILSASDRWRALRIDTISDNFVAMNANIECKAAPLLESLYIHLGYGEKFVRQPTLHLGPTPSLKSLILHAIGLKIGDVSCFVDKLEVLQIATPSVVSKLADAFVSSGLETPRLRHLDLTLHVPPLKRKQGAAFRKYAASLTSLSLGCVRDLGRMPSLLHSPLLERLSLHNLGYNALGSFVERLQTASLVFPALHTLSLSSIPDSSLHRVGYLCTAFPALERLALRNVEATPFINLLSISEYWPSLHTLTLYPVDYGELCPMVHDRIEAGCPLATLEIISARVIDTNSLSWLRKHVATVKQLPKMLVYPVCDEYDEYDDYY